MKNHFKYLGKRGICWCYQQAKIYRSLLIPTSFHGLSVFPFDAGQVDRIHQEKGSSNNAEGGSEPMNVEQADVAFAALHPTNVGAVHPSFVGELLLGQPPEESQC